MKVILVISSFVLAVLSDAASAAPKVDGAIQRESRMAVSKAEKVAIKEFRKRSNGVAKNISVRLLEDNNKDWVFVVEDEDQIPRPGSELYVTVSKRTAKAESYFGK
ncbi:hypothetical protein ACEN9F_15495 [Duganella sp. CT11-25]|uniref:hypothetical protein n=1 Tax=unclassified Duganella TaxID=2636909 RepID=UPI0039AEFA09